MSSILNVSALNVAAAPSSIQAGLAKALSFREEREERARIAAICRAPFAVREAAWVEMDEAGQNWSALRADPDSMAEDEGAAFVAAQKAETAYEAVSAATPKGCREALQKVLEEVGEKPGLTRQWIRAEARASLNLQEEAWGDSLREVLTLLDDGAELTQRRVLVSSKAEALSAALEAAHSMRFACCGMEEVASSCGICGCEEAHGPNSFPEDSPARTAAVEAEYGDSVVEGGAFTLAHHGSRSANPSPCLHENVRPIFQPAVVGLSHLDLDALGGVLAMYGMKPEAPSFWALAAFVDVEGPHRLGQSMASCEDLGRLYAYWAWSQKNRVQAPQDGSVLDVTCQVMEHGLAVCRVLGDDPEMLAAGQAFKEAEAALNEASYLVYSNGVVARKAAQFVNHLYVMPNCAGDTAKACVALNTVTQAITVSFAGPPPAGGAIAIVQGLWGDAAGGREAIGGSPRGRKMSEHDMWEAVAATIVAVQQDRKARVIRLEGGLANCTCAKPLEGLCGACREGGEAVFYGALTREEVSQPLEELTVQDRQRQHIEARSELVRLRQKKAHEQELVREKGVTLQEWVEVINSCGNDFEAISTGMAVERFRERMVGVVRSALASGPEFHGSFLEDILKMLGRDKSVAELVKEGMIRDCSCGSGKGSPGVHGGCCDGTPNCG